MVFKMVFRMNNNIVTWDIETHGLGGGLVIGGVYDGNNYYEFLNWEEFFNIIKRMPDNTCFYAHNGARYDNRPLLYEAFKKNLKVKNILTVQGGVVFKININGRTYDFRDSFFLILGKLKDLCKVFNVAQTKKEFDIIKWIDEGCPITGELRTYLKYDCISLYELLEKFYSEFDVNDVKLTIASTAFNILLKDETKRKALANYITKEDEIEIRKAYKGGRCEVYIREGKNLYKYDVNSMYPFVMRNFKYPTGDMIKIINKRRIDTYINTLKYIGVVKVNIKAPYQHIPYLVKKDETLNKLITPIGAWTDYITTFEYKEALKRGYEIDILEAYLYSKKENHFKEYVDHYYNIKKTSKGAKKQIAKLMLNSVYGKFGQKRNYDKIYTFDEIKTKKLNLCDFLPMDTNMFVKEEVFYHDRRVNPIIALFVTAYARHILYQGIENILKKGGNVYYADTDAIITDIKLDDDLVSDTELGKWSLEEDEINEYIAIEPKLYICDGKVKAKGIPKEEREKLDHEDFKEMLHGKSKSFQAERVIGFREQHKRINHDTTGYMCKIETTKEIGGKLKFDKRILNEDGITTRPIELKQKF